MSLNTRPRSPPLSIWRVRIGHNGGQWHDGPPQRARPRAEDEEESQGGRRTPPKKEEPREKASLQRSDGSVAPQPPKRALGCSFSRPAFLLPASRPVRQGFLSKYQPPRDPVHIRDIIPIRISPTRWRLLALSDRPG